MLIPGRLAVGAFLAFAVAACSPETPQTRAGATTGPEPSYVGSSACAGCHEHEYESWRTSQHALAMAPANPESVLADVDAQPAFFSAGKTVRFETDAPGYRATLADADGVVRPFPIVNTFGVAPLQQYLVAYRGGRRQALTVAWDSRAAADGGQRWFDLYPDELVEPGGVLHWTHGSQNWNAMCADCHSTRVIKGYDAAEDTYDTTFEALNVACEACHGPGSNHAAAPAPGYSAFLRRQRVQVDVCGHCHSRRAQIAEPFEPGADLLDYYLPALPVPPLYEADGQIADEVYVYGSFLQSRMYRRGVVCTDCHDAHAARTRAPGDAVCVRCHNPVGNPDFPTLAAGRYDSPAHHLHVPGSPGSRCRACHMPERTYMGVDDRHDHSFRVPRPDLTVDLGVPNACNDCHTDREATWARDVVAARFGPDRPLHFAPLLVAANRGRVDAEADLAAYALDTDQSPVARAAVLAALAGYQGGRSREALIAGLRDPDPLVRVGALRGVARFGDAYAWRLVRPLLADPVLGVRLEAFGAMLPRLPALPADGVRRATDRVLDEYAAAQALNADRPEAHVNLAGMYLHTGRPQAAEAALQRALTLEPEFVPAMVNLGDLYRALGRDDEAGAWLERAVATAPDSAEAVYALALWQVRNHLLEPAVAGLERAATLAPDRIVYPYTLGLALVQAGREADGLAVLEDALARFGDDRDVLLALATLNRDRGAPGRALTYARRLEPRFPDDPAIRALVAELGGGSGR